MTYRNAIIIYVENHRSSDFRGLEAGVLRNLLWFHSFRRGSIEEIVATLCEGPSPAPADKSKSSRNEQVLGIDGPCLYAYLGYHGTDAFGEAAFSLSQSSVKGVVSPFDTGGLRRRIAPLQGWTDEERTEYLAQYSWDHTGLYELLTLYPSSEGLSNYLDGGRPNSAGPHIHWNGTRVANIWQQVSNSWPAWTWELRSKLSLPAGRHIYRWSCSPSMFNEISRFADHNLDRVEIFEFLFQRYIQGGVSGLVAELKTHQSAP